MVDWTELNQLQEAEVTISGVKVTISGVEVTISERYREI